ncbi:patatin-like phospholipase family protein [Alkalimarinus sediminis]|uniref:Patatin-like phospholipase family protein n=1 Tax=Alkalimarinus sediminis TaxID=1632866 RepID=A0A9E8KQ55_9ALTE|nr:patatin-like phospholipase family protein [Alkalimarinus sediminis]UZW76043.1 patatin-like phospholipase family protein [Alkalimarinus sediminis]
MAAMNGNGKTVALVLGSGGARGYAHIGAIEILQERGYEIIAVAGCSVGAMVGGVYSANKLTEFKDWATGLDQFDVLKLVDLSLSSPGAIRGNRVFAFVRELIGDIKIEDLPIPYTAVATDLLAHKEIWFQEGPLHQAVRASVAIPSLMTPVILGERLLVDGGLLNPLPIFPTISSHADLIVAVNLGWENGSQIRLRDVYTPQEESKIEQWMDRVKVKASTLFDKPPSGNQANTLDPSVNKLDPTINELDTSFKENASPEALTVSNGSVESESRDFEIVQASHKLPFGMIDIMNLSFEAMQSALTQYKLAGYPPDVLVNIPKESCKTFDYHKAPELIRLGRELTEKALLKHESQFRAP